MSSRRLRCNLGINNHTLAGTENSRRDELRIFSPHGVFTIVLRSALCLLQLLRPSASKTPNPTIVMTSSLEDGPDVGRDADDNCHGHSHEPSEEEPLLPRSHEPRHDQPLLRAPEEASWKPPAGFLWIQVAIMSNVFLYGFDGTITAATYAVISSDFDAANTASWLTTSYLITSTAFQPLYGRVSDIFGRRICFFISTVTFALGCLGCGVAGDIVFLNCMRALTGFGGGGLMTMGEFLGLCGVSSGQR